MALSAREILLVHEVLDIPPVATAYELWGVIGETAAVQHWSFNTAQEAVAGVLAVLTAAEEARVQELVAQWDTVSTDEVELKKAETVEGTVSSASGKRELIRRRLQVYIPIFREGEIRAKEYQLTTGGNRMIRG